jgi:uncharacterized membrane protein
MVIYNVSVSDVFSIVDNVIISIHRNPIPFILFVLFTAFLFIFLNSFYDYIKDPDLTKKRKQRLEKIFIVSLICLISVIAIAFYLGYIGVLMGSS